jgi:hypothetical protein
MTLAVNGAVLTAIQQDDPTESNGMLADVTRRTDKRAVSPAHHQQPHPQQRAGLLDKRLDVLADNPSSVPCPRYISQVDGHTPVWCGNTLDETRIRLRNTSIAKYLLEEAIVSHRSRFDHQETRRNSAKSRRLQ